MQIHVGSRLACILSRISSSCRLELVAGLRVTSWFREKADTDPSGVWSLQAAGCRLRRPSERELDHAPRSSDVAAKKATLSSRGASSAVSTHRLQPSIYLGSPSNSFECEARAHSRNRLACARCRECRFRLQPAGSQLQPARPFGRRVERRPLCASLWASRDEAPKSSSASNALQWGSTSTRPVRLNLSSLLQLDPQQQQQLDPEQAFVLGVRSAGSSWSPVRRVCAPLESRHSINKRATSVRSSSTQLPRVPPVELRSHSADTRSRAQRFRRASITQHTGSMASRPDAGFVCFVLLWSRYRAEQRCAMRYLRLASGVRRPASDIGRVPSGCETRAFDRRPLFPLGERSPVNNNKIIAGREDSRPPSTPGRLRQVPRSAPTSLEFKFDADFRSPRRSHGCDASAAANCIRRRRGLWSRRQARHELFGRRQARGR